MMLLDKGNESLQKGANVTISQTHKYFDNLEEPDSAHQLLSTRTSKD